MSMHSNSAICLTLFGITLATIGCGSTQRTLGTVFGTVTCDGVPLTEGLVLFQDDDRGIHITATIEEGGYYQVVMAEGIGLPLGNYDVAVQPPPQNFETGRPPPVERKFPEIPARYRSTETSGLELSVADGENRFDIRMSKP